MKPRHLPSCIPAKGETCCTKLGGWGDLCKADGSALAITRSQTPQLPPSFSHTFHPALANFPRREDVLLPCCAPVENEKLKSFPEDSQFLRYCTVVHVMWRMWFHTLPAKSLLLDHVLCQQKSSRHNLPGKALHAGKRSVALRCPVPKILEMTCTDKHREWGMTMD